MRKSTPPSNAPWTRPATRSFIWTTGRKISRADWTGAGAPSCTKRLKKPSRPWAKWACLSVLTFKQHRHLGVADGKEPFGEIVQGPPGRLELFRERVKHTGQIVPRR